MIILHYKTLESIFGSECNIGYYEKWGSDSNEEGGIK
jgi:hypothetical protein